MSTNLICPRLIGNKLQSFASEYNESEKKNKLIFGEYELVDNIHRARSKKLFDFEQADCDQMGNLRVSFFEVIKRIFSMVKSDELWSISTTWHTLQQFFDNFQILRTSLSTGLVINATHVIKLTTPTKSNCLSLIWRGNNFSKLIFIHLVVLWNCTLMKMEC